MSELIERYEVKACPFCGHKDTLTFRKDYLQRGNFGGFYTVTCSTLDGGCGASTGLFCTKQEAVEAWNIRPDFGLAEAISSLYEKINGTGGSKDG